MDEDSKKIRLELVKDRSAEIKKKIIFHYIGFNNTIITSVGLGMIGLVNIGIIILNSSTLDMILVVVMDPLII